jgi:hypothetical protein
MGFVRFDGSALFAREVLQQSPCGVEGLMNGDASVAAHGVDLRLLVKRRVLDILQVSMQRRLVANDKWRAAGNGQLDAHVKVPAVTTMSMGKVDDDMASRDAGVELFELAQAPADVRLDVVGMREAAESHLYRNQGHRRLSLMQNAGSAPTDVALDVALTSHDSQRDAEKNSARLRKIPHGAASSRVQYRAGLSAPPLQMARTMDVINPTDTRVRFQALGNISEVSPIVVVPAVEWCVFLERFSRRHRGWLATIHGFARDAPLTRIPSEPLECVALERRDPEHLVRVTFASGISLCAPRPRAVRVQKTTEGAEAALEVETAAGAFIRLAFRATALPDQLDGLAPS